MGSAAEFVNGEPGLADPTSSPVVHLGYPAPSKQLHVSPRLMSDVVDAQHISQEIAQRAAAGTALLQDLVTQQAFVATEVQAQQAVPQSGMLVQQLLAEDAARNLVAYLESGRIQTRKMKHEQAVKHPRVRTAPDESLLEETTVASASPSTAA